TTYILFGILIVLIGVIAVALWKDSGAREDKSKFVLPALQNQEAVKVEDIDRVEIQPHEKDKIVLVRDGDRWTITEPRKLRADRIAVTHLIEQLFKATSEDKT